MRAALLIRCSTDRQDYERQILDLKRKAEEFGFEVNDDIIFGEHITGRDDATKSTRKSIDNLFNAIKAKKLDCVLINEVSRLSRDPTSGSWWVRQLINENIPTYFRDLNKWTIDLQTMKPIKGIEEEIIHNLEGAKHYLESLKTQTASGRRKKLQDNQMTQSVAFGYRRKGGKNKYDRNTVIPDENESVIVKYVYETYLKEGATLKSTALAVSGKFNIPFTVGKVYKILAYRGYHLGYTTVTTTDPDTKKVEVFQINIGVIIEKELYDRTYEKLKSNRTSSKIKNNAQIEHLLSKLIKCPCCGYSFTPRARNDKRQAYSWKCMSRVNNVAPDCTSTINLNDDKMNALIWELIKKECIIPNNLTKKEREERISEQNEKIENMNDEIGSLLNSKESNDRKAERAYTAYINAPSGTEEVALKLFHKTTIEIQESNKQVDARINELNGKIKYCESKIDRYKETDFAKDYLDSVESDHSKKREVFKEHIKVIYPYKLAYRKVVLEVQTMETIFYVIFDANQRKEQVATYISYELAVWQRGNNRYESATKEGDYFFVPNAQLIMETDKLDAVLSVNEMETVCKDNGWTLDYSNYLNNIYKNNYISNIEKYNIAHKK